MSSEFPRYAAPSKAIRRPLSEPRVFSACARVTAAGDSSLIRRASRMSEPLVSSAASRARHQRRIPSFGRQCPPTPSIGTRRPPVGIACPSADAWSVCWARAFTWSRSW